MTANPRVYSQFTVSSGCLCYGALHNICHGASMPVQEFPMTVNRHPGGTVVSQILEYNITAKNGIWNAFQLVEKGTDHVCGWFVSHSEVDPEAEVDKILRVSGSPYEPDSGSSLNDENTAAEGVLVINRYDWGYYDNRAKENFTGVSEADDDSTQIVIYEAAGLVDWKSARAELLRWQKKKSHERDTSPAGVWMHIPDGEYMFGRFGFDEACTAARSFLFFTTYTNFTRTTFAGLDRTLRLEESGEERFQRHLREGRNFEGLDTLEKLRGSWGDLPTESEYLGPYESQEYILLSTDLDAVRVRPALNANAFADPWKESCHALLNELVMSYFEHFIAPASSCDTVVAAATSLFPKRAVSNSLDGCMYSFMTKPYSDPITGFDFDAVGSRVKRFLNPRCDDNSLIRDDKFVAGLCACIAFLLSEVLELANNYAKDSQRSKLVPVDIRLAVLLSSDLNDVFKYSRVIWKGSGHTSGAAQSSQSTEPSSVHESAQAG